MNNKHIIIYSHGFGVRQDDRGLLSGVSQALPEVESILFDYYQVDEEKKTLTTCPFSEQVAKLNQVIDAAKKTYPGALIDIIAHSQGTIVVALAKPEGVRKTIFLAPVFDMGLERTLSRYVDNPEAQIDLAGTTHLPPIDGLLRIVPARYWEERRTLNTFAEYNALAEKTELIIIEAKQDDILPKVDISALDKKINIISLDGDHGFYGSARESLISEIRKHLI